MAALRDPLRLQTVPGVFGVSSSGSLPADDLTLILRMAALDATALAELYDRYSRIVFGMLHHRLPSPEAAEEVCIDAFHRAWRAAGSYRVDRGSVRTWLFTIARNAAIDWRRTHGKRFERDAPLDDARDHVSEDRVEDHVVASDRARSVRAAVAGLPPEQRLCIELAAWSGLTQAEIAARTGAPIGTVKSRVRLGMAKLRESLVEVVRDA